MRSDSRMLFSTPLPPSRLLFAAVLSATLGMTLERFVSFDPVLVGILFVLCLWVSSLRVPSGSRQGAILLACLFVGALRYHSFEATTQAFTLPTQADEMHTFLGRIEGEPSERLTGRDVTLVSVRSEGQSMTGRLLTRLPIGMQARPGDELSFTCSLRIPEPFEGFAYDKHLASRGIAATCFRPSNLAVLPRDAFSIQNHLLRFKAFLRAGMASALPEPHASFSFGVLFGGSGLLTDGIRDAFSRTGLAHILAASGYNVALFSAWLYSVLARRFGRDRAILFSSLAVAAYAVLAGLTASVVRAAVMAGLVLFARASRRPPWTPNILVFSGILMLAVNPSLLFDDIGFQLSFAATSGLLLFGSAAQQFFSGVTERFGLREAVAASAAASLTTTPLILWYFGNVSLFAPVVNMLVLPVIPVLMVAAFGATLAGLFFPTIAFVFGLPAFALSSFVLWMTSLLASVSWVSFSLSENNSHLLAAVMGFLILFLFLKIRRFDFA